MSCMSSNSQKSKQMLMQSIITAPIIIIHTGEIHGPGTPTPDQHKKTAPMENVIIQYQKKKYWQLWKRIIYSTLFSIMKTKNNVQKLK